MGQSGTSGFSGTFSGFSGFSGTAGIGLPGPAGPDGAQGFSGFSGFSGFGGGLDSAYDFGGAGGGRKIKVDAGSVVFSGTSDTGTVLDMFGGMHFLKDNVSDIGATGFFRPRKIFVGTSVDIGETSSLNYNNTTKELEQKLSGIDKIRLTPDEVAIDDDLAANKEFATKPAFATLIGDKNDFNVNDTSLLGIFAAAPTNITGFSGYRNGHLVFLANIGSATVTLKHQSTLSLAQSRIIGWSGSDATMAANTSVALAYVGSESRWRVITPPSSATGGGNGNASAFRMSFTNSDLTSGILAVNHSLGEKYNVVQVYRDNDKRVIPDEVTVIDADNLTISLGTFGTISGTWNVVVVGGGTATGGGGGGGGGSKSLSAGFDHSHIVENGATFGWGTNASGEVGDGTTISRSSPVSVTGGHSFVKISSGRHALATKADGSAWAWGSNFFGELGDDTNANRSSPVSVLGDHSFDLVSAGGGSLATKADGSAWAWGNNVDGQVGDATTTRRSSPVSVVGSHSFSEVSSGLEFSVARKADGSAWAWGLNSSGQVGDSSISSKSSPASVVGGHSFTSIGAGDRFSVGLKANGSAWAWGSNSSGQLGDNTTSPRSSPVSIVGGHLFIQIMPRGSFVLARKSDGSAWAWGDNIDGEVGDNTSFINRSSPVSVVGANVFDDVSGGSRHSLARKLDGTLWGWGNNSFGEVGDNTTTNRSSPVSVVR